MTFRAALLHENASTLSVENISVSAPSYGQVLVRVLAAGICGKQLMEIDGTMPTGPKPHPMGHEGVGIVEAVGIGVTTVSVGQKVVLHWRKGDGVESNFPNYQLDGLPITGGKVTTFMEYALVSENRCTAVATDVPDEFCTLLGCSLSTALGTIEHEAKLLMGEWVLVIGCGGLGLNLIMASRMQGATWITAWDVVESKKESAVGLGANAFGDPAVLKITYDVIIDTTGNEEAIANAMPLLRPSGRFILVGQPKGYIRIPGAKKLFGGQGCTIKATQGGCFNPSTDVPRYVNAWRSGHLKIEGIVTHRFGLSDINEAIALVRAGQAGRVLITP